MTHGTSDRGATIHIDQLPNGYWAGRVEVRVPGLPSQQFQGDSFHDAGEALDWARFTIESAVVGVGRPPFPFAPSSDQRESV